MKALSVIENRGRQLIRAAAVVAALGAVALTQARPAHADGPTLAAREPVVTAEYQWIGGYELYLVISIQNTGVFSTGEFLVTVRSGPPPYTFPGKPPPRPLQAFAVSGLGAGQSTTRYHKMPPYTPGGAHTRTVVGDSTNAVAEVNEGNNTVTKTYVHGPG